MQTDCQHIALKLSQFAAVQLIYEKNLLEIWNTTQLAAIWLYSYVEGSTCAILLLDHHLAAATSLAEEEIPFHIYEVLSELQM